MGKPENSNDKKDPVAGMKTIVELGLWGAAALTAFVSLYHLYLDDRNSVKWVLIILLYVILFLLLWKIAFTRKKTEIALPEGVTDKRYAYPKLFVAARLLLAVLLSIPFLLWKSQKKSEGERRKKFVVVVANLYGTKSDEYQVTEEVVSHLVESTKNDKDTIIDPISTVITEKDGSSKAIEIGKAEEADLVVWGRYAATDKDVRVTLHVENLAKSNMLPSDTSSTYVNQAPIENLKSFTFQDQLSNELTVLTLLVGSAIKYDARDFRAVVTHLDKALAMGNWPRSISSRNVALCYRANSLLLLNRNKEAIRDYSVILKASPHVDQLYNNRGVALENVGEKSRALSDYSQAIKINPKYGIGYLNRGGLYTDIGQGGKALSDYDRAVKYGKQSAAYNGIGIIYAKMNKNDLALKNFEKSIQSDPDQFDPFYNRSKVYVELGKLREAMADITRAISIDPKSAYAHSRCGLICQAQGNKLRAMLEFNEAIRLDEKCIEALNNRATLYLDEGDNKRAHKEFSVIIKKWPHYLPAYLNRAFISLNTGDLNEASTDIEKAIEIDPRRCVTELSKNIEAGNDAGVVYLGRGHSYMAMKKYKEALNDFNHVVKTEPDQAVGYYDRGVAEGVLGMNQLALRDFTKAIHLGGMGADPLINRAYLLSGLGRNREAIADLTAAITLTPHDSTIFRYRAQVYQVVGDSVRARADLKRAKQLDR